MDQFNISLATTKPNMLPFFIVVFVFIAVYAGVHPYVKNYCKGRLWVSVVLKILLALFWMYNFCCYCDWFGTSLTTRKNGLWGLLFDNRLGSSEYGNVMLTSVCGFLTMFLPIILIFDKKLTIARFLFPLGILGGVIAIVPDVMMHTDGPVWRTLLFWNMGTIFRHLCLLTICFVGLLNTPKYNLKKHLWIYLSGISMFYLYGLFVALAIIPSADRINISGLFANDYGSGGCYEMVGTWIPIYPLNMILALLVTTGFPIGIVALKEVCSRKIPYYRNIPKVFKNGKSLKQK